nr:unnamed protein product [Digitaria exilis]
MPPEPVNCGSVLRRPRISGGAVSEMYTGTSVTARPTAKPSTRRERSSTYTLGDHSMRSPARNEDAMSMGRRPTESETGPEKVVITVAPMSDVATTRPSTAGCASSSSGKKKTR